MQVFKRTDTYKYYSYRLIKELIMCRFFKINRCLYHAFSLVFSLFSHASLSSVSFLVSLTAAARRRQQPTLPFARFSGLLRRQQATHEQWRRAPLH